MLRTLRLIIGVVAVLLVSTAHAPAQDLPTLRVGYTSGGIGSMTLFIADAEGYYRDEGLKVELVPFDSAAPMIAPLGAGQLDVGGGSAAAGLYNAVARGVDLRVVANMDSDPRGYGFEPLLVRSDLVKSGRFRSPADLRGMTIAVSLAGSTSWEALDELLSRYGLKLGDVKAIPLPYSDEPSAFKNGSIDAAISLEPLASRIVHDGLAQRIMGNDAFDPNAEAASILFGKNLVHDHRDLGVKFMRAYIRAARFYDDALSGGHLRGQNADAVIALIVKQTPVKDPALIGTITPTAVNPDGHVNLTSMRRTLEFFKQQGWIEGTVSADQAVDDDFVTQALKTLPAYHHAGGPL